MTSGHTVAKENSDGVAQSRLIKREPDWRNFKNSFSRTKKFNNNRDVQAWDWKNIESVGNTVTFFRVDESTQSTFRISLIGIDRSRLLPFSLLNDQHYYPAN